MQRHYAVVLGTRPNFIKAASLFARGKEYPNCLFTVIHTGQHFDSLMSDVFFKELGLPKPDVHLQIKGKFHTEKIGNMFNALKRTFAERRFDGVILFGDVNSTMAAGIAAAKNGQNIIHIEAGLRSHDRRMPEEINRAVVDHLSEILFTTEPSGNVNLAQEGISEDRMHYVGNVMIETMERFREKGEKSNVLKTLRLTPRSYCVATIHRQENTDDSVLLERILNILVAVNVDLPVIWPLHPGTLARIKTANLERHLEGIRVIEPLGYFEFFKLMLESSGVVTDSGGIQEETAHLGIPCATLRDNTERPITLEIGSNKLFPPASANARDVLAHFARRDFKKGHIPLWDMDVSKRILDVLSR